MRRRNKVTPFEVMREPAQREEHTEHPPPASAPAPASTTAHHREFAWPAWLNAGTPIVLRLPRGLLILAAVLLVGLLCLAYWVGHSRGFSQAEANAPNHAAAAEAPRPARQPPADDHQPDIAWAQQQDDDSQPDPPSDRLHAQRQDGYAYLIVAHYSPEGARMLQEFLAEHGVASALEPVNNYVRVRCLRGFPLSGGSDEAERFEERIHQLGRQWERQVRGADNLSDAFWMPSPPR